MLRWYAAYTYPRHEKKVVEQLNLHEVESFLPLYRSLHQWRNRTKRTVELPLFPGYLFVKVTEPQQRRVLATPGVLNLVGVRGRAVPIADTDIEMLRVGCSKLKAEPHPFVKTGTRVRVCRGPLAGNEGILIQKKQGFRFVLSMDLLMQAMSVEVDAADIEPIRPSVNS